MIHGFTRKCPQFSDQNHSPHQISLSTRAQQILNGNNRPLRSEKIDIDVINHLIREANWKRQCGMKKEVRRKLCSSHHRMQIFTFRSVSSVEIMERTN